MQNTRINISPVRLKNELKKLGYTPERASVKLGYADNYLHVAMNRGYLTKPAVVSVENVLGIKIDDIQTEVVEAAEVVTRTDSMDYMKLYNVIYGAVKNAMIDALNGEKKEEEK